MAQKAGGPRSLLSFAWAYRLWKVLLGGRRGLTAFTEGYLHVRSGDAVLDIGCGTADILAVLPPGVEYVGFDQSRGYIEAAHRRFGNRGSFVHSTVAEMRAPEAHFDVVLALGVLHHLEDNEALALFAMARDALKPDGRLVSIDGVYHKEQSRIARWMVSRDRGQNIRDQKGYEALARRHFVILESEIRHDMLWFPYSHIVMTCHP